jgi:hypothetical protein
MGVKHGQSQWKDEECKRVMTMDYERISERFNVVTEMNSKKLRRTVYTIQHAMEQWDGYKLLDGKHKRRQMGNMGERKGNFKEEDIVL